MAGPTCGKSTFQNMYDESGINIVDSDTIINEILPVWFTEKKFAEYTPENAILGSLLYRTIGVCAGIELLRDDNSIILTNMSSSSFIKGIGQVCPTMLVNGKLPLAVFRESAQEIVDLSKQRGNGISLALAEKWVNSAKEGLPKVAHKVIFLKEKEFLTDVFEFRTSTKSWLKDFRESTSPFLLKNSDTK